MADTVETLKIKVVAETNAAEKGFTKLRSRVDQLSSSLGTGIPGGGKSGAAGTAAKGLNAATQVLSGSLGGLVGNLTQLGPKGAAIAAAIGLATKAIQQACQASQEFIGYMTQLLGKIDMGTSAMREFNAELTKTARNSSVSKTDLGKFFAQTKTSFTDASQMQRDADFAKQLISYYGDINTAAKAYQKTLAMDLDTQKKIREQMQLQYNLTQDTGEAGLKAIKQELLETLETLGTILLQVLNPIIQAIKVILGALNSVFQIVKNIVGAFSGITGAGTMADAMMNGAEATGEASDAMNELNKEMGEYNGKLSGLDEVATLDSGNSFAMADNPALDSMADAMSETQEGFSLLTGPLEMFSRTFEKVAGLLQTIIAPILKVVKELIDQIRDVVAGIFDAGQGFLDTILEPIGEAIQMVVGLLVGVLKPVFDVIVKSLTRQKALIQKIFEAVGKILTTLFKVWQKALEPIFSILSVMLECIMDIFTTVFDLLFSILDPILDVVTSLMDMAAEVYGVVGDIIRLLMDLGKPILDVIIGLVKMVFDSCKPIFDIISGIFNVLLKPILDIILRIVDVVKNRFGPVFEGIKNIVQGVLFVIKGMFNGIIDGVNAVIRLINNMTAGLSKMWTWMGIPAIPQIQEIKHLYTGGSAEVGELVNIRENGPELVSYGGGKMEVMNNDQIIAAVAQGVATAIQGANFGGGEYRFYMDGQEMNVRLEKARERSGTQNIGRQSRQGGY